MSNIVRLLRNVFCKKRVEQDLDEEIRFYLETQTQNEIAAGVGEAEARRAARLELGSVDSLKDSVRDVRAGAMLERIWQDVRYAMRTLRNKPGFTAAAVLVLGLGIGANGAVFSFVNALLLKPLSVAKPEELIGLYNRDTKHPDTYRAFSYPNYVDIRDNNPVFSSLMAQNMAMVGVKEGDRTRRAFTGVVSANYFSTLGVSLLEGRPFTAKEEKPRGESMVILSYAFWKRTGGEGQQALGRQLTINGSLFTVVGVTPKGFTGTTVLLGADMYVPLGAYDVVMNHGSGSSRRKTLAARDNDYLLLVGRLKPGLTQRAVGAKLAVVASQLAKAFPAENENWSLQAGSLSRLGIFDRPANDQPLLVPAILLLPLAAVILLIASLNLANMMMARGTVRRKEIAIRLAIGGGRRRIVQQLVTEGLVLAALGGVAGLLLASWSTKLLVGSLASVAPVELVYDAAPDVRVLAVTLIFCVMSAIVFGLFPAWRLSKPDTWLDLKENTGEDVAGSARRLFSRSNILVMTQLSLSLMMLTGAGLFIHSAMRAANVRPGFSLDNEILAEVDASMINYDEAGARQLYSTLRERLRQVPGVKSVAMAATVPFGRLHLVKDVESTDAVASMKHPAAIARFNIVTDEYFRTLGIPLLRGRPFMPAEDVPESKSHVAILDNLAAEKLWPGGNALGKRIRLQDGVTAGKAVVCQVVGIVGNVRESILGSKAEPHVYFPSGQQYQADMEIHLKVAGGAPEGDRQMLETIRREIRTTDDRLPLLALETMRGNLDSSLDIWVVRAGAHVLEIFGAVALFLAVIGLYAVNAYTVARRTREIGIRMAVGADAWSTLRMILRECFYVIAIGAGIGLLLAMGLTKVLAGFLYGIPGSDPVVMVAASFVMATVALLACYLPARRASRVDPIIALRYE